MKYGNSPNDVGWLIAQFAAGTLGVAQEINPPLIANGTDTNIGFCLVVRWRIILLVLSGLGGIQLIVFLVAVLIGNSVVVKDDSRLAIARLLRRKYSIIVSVRGEGVGPLPAFCLFFRRNLCFSLNYVVSENLYFCRPTFSFFSFLLFLVL
jgi:hypothetical protein